MQDSTFSLVLGFAAIVSMIWTAFCLLRWLFRLVTKRRKPKSESTVQNKSNATVQEMLDEIEREEAKVLSGIDQGIVTIDDKGKLVATFPDIHPDWVEFLKRYNADPRGLQYDNDDEITVDEGKTMKMQAYLHSLCEGDPKRLADLARKHVKYSTNGKKVNVLLDMGVDFDFDENDELVYDLGRNKP